MTYEIFKAADRGGANHGWLTTHHSYSFANYYDENRIHFGALRVVNDDQITGGMGFGKHPHQNMEIITLPLSGAIKHEDSLGNGSLIEVGDIQVMSAGTGVTHSEMNGLSDQSTAFFQIWIIPNKENASPRYQQISLKDFEKENQLFQVLSPNEGDAGVWIHQNAWMFLGNYTQQTEETYSLKIPGQGVFLMVVEGEIIFDNQRLERRDVVEIKNTNQISFSASPSTKILLIEVPLEF